MEDQHEETNIDEDINLQNIFKNDPLRIITLLMNAITTGNVSKIKEILENFVTDSEFTKFLNKTHSFGEITSTLIDQAWNFWHFDIVLLLLNANSIFPHAIHQFDNAILPNDLQTFMETMRNFHNFINEENTKKLSIIINHNQHLRHFYNQSNNSAIIIAIKEGKFKAFELLISQNIQAGHEEKIFEKLYENQRVLIQNSFINLQGKKIKLKSVLGGSFKNVINNLSPKCIVELLKNETFAVGEKQPKLNSFNRAFYNKESEIKIKSRYDLAYLKKFIIISDLPKSGRTTAVKKMIMHIKSQFSESWVAYNDLKTSWSKEFKSVQDVKKMLCKNELEEVLMMNCTSVDIVWDGVDELKAEDKKLFFDAVNEISKNSHLRQWIITQPKFSDDLKALDENKMDFLILKEFNKKDGKLYLEQKLLEGIQNTDNEGILITKENVMSYTENLLEIGVLKRPCSFHLINLIANFGFSIKLSEKFLNSADFYEKLTNWSIKNIKNCQNFDEKQLRNFIFNLALKSFMKFLDDYERELKIKAFKSQCEMLEILNLKFDQNDFTDCELLSFKNTLIDESLTEFFIAKYAFENVFYLEEVLNDEECRIRVILLQLIASSCFPYEISGYLTLLLEFIERDHRMSQPHRLKLFNLHIPAVEFALYDCINIGKLRNYKKNVINFCNFFKYDKETMKTLWKINENETFFLWVKREWPNFSKTFLEIAEIYFTHEEIEKLKCGKQQEGNNLFYFWKNKCEIQEMSSESNLQSTILQNHFNFFEFLEHVKKSLTTPEYREILLQKSIFCDYVKIFEDFKTLWAIIENTLTREDIIKMLNSPSQYHIIIFKNALTASDPKLLEAFFEKLEQYLSEDDICNQIVKPSNDNHTSLMIAIWSMSKDVFKIYWKFMLKHVKGGKLKEFLLIGHKYYSEEYEIRTAFHYAALRNDQDIFNMVHQLYCKTMKNEEFEGIFEEFKFYHELIKHSSSKICKAVADQMELSLKKEDLKYKLKFIYSYYLKYDACYGKRIKPFVDLLRRYFEHDEITSKFLEWNEQCEKHFEDDDSD